MIFKIRTQQRARRGEIWGVVCKFLVRSEFTLAINVFDALCRELVCITVKWTWYNGRDKFFHITSGRINTWKGVNQLKELFFLNLIFFLKYIFEIDKS